MDLGTFWILFFMVNFALFGAALARHLGRNPWGWGPLCLFLALPGIAILCIAGKTQAARDAEREDVNGLRWTALKLVDPAIEDAARQAGAVDREKLLSQVYLAAGDRSYLEAALKVALDKPHRAPRFPLAS